ncbi:hypothetical protein HD_1166 [[Haemophilus] ducreyi 35000HP]|uniref:Uncharacterized protein n=1 Tax=Haemophilus ducreyi (strain 35000HP / ATCC 700724) TaxID=233412 RepID=Q7VM43_HAEDU|nr:hypothetical protein HD_1166 [[Haemophilus] ducreyi 35000HP]
MTQNRFIKPTDYFPSLGSQIAVIFGLNLPK